MAEQRRTVAECAAWHRQVAAAGQPAAVFVEVTAALCDQDGQELDTARAALCYALRHGQWQQQDQRRDWWLCFGAVAAASVFVAIVLGTVALLLA